MPFLPRAEAPFLLAASGIYLIAMLLVLAQLFLTPPALDEDERSNRWSPGNWARGVLWVAAILHVAALAGQGPTLFMSKAGVVGLFGWILTVTYLMVGQRLGTGSGAVITPVALAAALYSVITPGLHPVWTPPGDPDAYWLAAHVIIILAAYVSLAFAFAASLLYTVQEGLLKKRKLTGLWRKLPSLQVADEWIYRATGFGLALLTMGIFTGVAYGMFHEGTYSVWRDPKVLFSVATWVAFALYMTARLWLGWHGRRANLVVIYGFVLLVISFLGTPHLLEGTVR